MSAAVRILDWPAPQGDLRTPALWDARSAAAAMGGTASGDFLASGVEIDSRDVVPGDLFFALKGESTDGHRFAAGALAQGAAAVVVDRPPEGQARGPHILVPDTTAALVALGAAARARVDAVEDARIVGVTGSVGKTGVKEAIFAALDRAGTGQRGGRAHRSVKSYNNHVGVPLSLARMPADARFGVFEMGMNHAGEIAALTRQVRPDVAVITTIAPAHIENLGSEAAIAAAKAEIFEGLRPGGTAVIPADSVHCADLVAAARAHAAHVVTFGRAGSADVRLLDAIRAGGGGSLVTVQMGDTRLCLTVGMPGAHWVANALAVMAAVRAAGGNLGAAGLALAEMAELPGRGARTEIVVGGSRGGNTGSNTGSGTALLIDESYNANPASMRATLAQLGITPARRRIAVLGAMKELGSHAASFHAALARPLAEAGVDFAILVGDEMGALVDALERDDLGKSVRAQLGKPLAFAHCRDAREAADALDDFGLDRGDVVLIKGSNSVGLGRLVAQLTSPAT